MGKVITNERVNVFVSLLANRQQGNKK